MPQALQPTSQPATNAREPIQAPIAATVPGQAHARFFALFGSRIGGDVSSRQRLDSSESKQAPSDQAAEELAADTAEPHVGPVPELAHAVTPEAHRVATAQLRQAAGYARSHQLQDPAAQQPQQQAPVQAAAPKPSSEQQQGAAPQPQADAAPKSAEPAPQAAQPAPHTRTIAAQQPAPQSPAQHAEQVQKPSINTPATAASKPAASAQAAPQTAARQTTASPVNAAATRGKQAGTNHAAPTKTPTPARNPQQAQEAFDAQLARGLAAVLKQKGGSVTMRLKPDELGELRIKMTLDKNGVAAKFEPASARARDLLEQNMPQLRSALEAKGLAVERLRVDAPTQQDGAPRDAAHDSERARSEGADRERESGSAKDWAQPGGHDGGGAARNPHQAWTGAKDGTGPSDGEAGGSGGLAEGLVGDEPMIQEVRDEDGVRVALRVDALV